MRTIGKKNKELVKTLTRLAIDNEPFSYAQVENTVIGKLPCELLETWEKH